MEDRAQAETFVARDNGIDYRASPTVARFMANVGEPGKLCRKAIMGPYGSGKTVGCVMHCMQLASLQPAGTDGVRRTRFAVVRSTFVELDNTTRATFFDWIKFEEWGIGTYWKTKKLLVLEWGRGWGRVHCEIYFFALEDEKDEGKLKSFEFTHAYINELVETEPSLISAISKRAGRYPPPKMGVKPQDMRYGIFADTNPCDEGDEWWSILENFDPDNHGVPLETAPVFEVYKQPSGRSPEAENVEWLPPDYYTVLPGMTKDDVAKKIDGRYGQGKLGRAVHGGFRYNVHVADREMAPMPGLPLIAGMDCALMPSMSFGQVGAYGRVFVLGECMGINMGTERFVVEVLKPYLFSMGFNASDLTIFIDPSGGVRSQTDERTVHDVLRRHGFRSRSAKTNLKQPRIDAGDRLLGSMADGKPMVSFDPRCRRTIGALRGGYRYHAEKPGEIVKDIHSHIAEAWQYMALHVHTPLSSPVRRRREIKRVSMRAWVG